MDYKVNFKTKTMEWKTKYNALVDKIQELENKINNKKMYIYTGTFTPSMQNTYEIHICALCPILISSFSSIRDIFSIFEYGIVGYSTTNNKNVVMVADNDLSNLIFTGETGEEIVSDFQVMSIEVYDTDGNYITILEI